MNATYVVSGANGVAAADLRQVEGVAAARVASPSTPGANSGAIAYVRLGVDDADNGHVSCPLTSLRRLRTWLSTVL